MKAYLADIVVIVYLALFGVLGFRKGLVMSIMRFITTFIAFAATVLLMNPVSAYLQSTGIYNTIGDFIKNIIQVSKMQDNFTTNTKVFGEGLFGNLLNNIATTGGNLVFDSLVSTIVGFIINILLFAVLFAICLFILKCITKLLDRIAALPVLNILNRFLGFLIGAIKAGILLYLLAGVIFIFVPVENRIHVDQQIGSSRSFDLFIQNNMITNMFQESPFYSKM